MRRAFFQMIALVLLGTAVGFAYNAASPKGIPVKGGKQAVMEQQGTRMLTTDEVKFYREQPGTILLDARSAEEYELGHVAGAASLPLDRFDAAYPQLEKELVKAKMIIIYCSGGSCGTSEEVAKKLAEKGIKNLAIDTDGLPGWMRAKLPIKSGQER
jgi:rhodanese-related sulfurtransferase